MKKRTFWKTFGVISLFSLLPLSYLGFEKEVKPARADGTRTVYLVPSIWDVQDAEEKFHAWLYGSDSESDAWATFTADGTTSRYKTEIDDSYKNIIFTRGENATPSWSIWNQTEDLVLPTDGKNMFTITSWDGGDDGKSTGTWTTYTPPAVSYTVNLYVDSVKVASETVGAGQIPADRNPGYGKVFDGWYDSGHNKVTAINSNTSIYGYTDNKATATFALDTSAVSSVFTTPLKLYAWDANGSNASWPGTNIADVNSITVTYDASLVISDGTHQTVDIPSVQDGKTLKILNSTTGEENKYEYSWITPTPAPEPSEGPGQSVIFDSKNATYYQLLVYSFADGAGNDGIGDFKGIKDHLDYLVNLGIGGLYLSPVQSADSYHGYDTNNYYTVNSDYEKGGYTLKNLVDDCHAVGIKVILDMVLNHSSWNCSWRTEHPNWYSGSDAFSGMIDFNFNNSSLRNEIKNVGRYWLSEYGVDGFRLDAVRWIYNTGSGEPTYQQHLQSVAWWNEFYEACKEEKADVYMIGEDYIYDEEEIALYQSSGLDSLFDFEIVNSIDGAATLARPGKYISYLVNHQRNIRNALPNAIAASFLSNHDRGRYGSHLGPNQYTLAGLMNILAPGNSYIYYGDELNLQVNKTGGYDDFAHRTPMPFASETTVMNSYLKGFGGGVTSVTSLPYGGGTADAKAASNTSIYAAFAKATALKNNNPILYTGEVTANGNNQDNTIGSYFITENDTTLTVIYNTANVAKNLTFAENITLVGDVSYTGSASVSGSSLTMPAYSVAILEGRQTLSKSAKTGLYVKGTMTGWDVEDDYELQVAIDDQIDGKILNVTITAGTEFKIASEDWSEAYGFSKIYDNTDFPKPSQLVIGTDSDNILCNTTTTFNIYLLDSSFGNSRLIFVDSSTVTNPDGGYLVGGWNGWGMSGRITLNEIMPGEIYKVERVPLSANTEFKLVIYEIGFEAWISCSSVTYTEGYPVSSYGENLNCKVSKSGIYDVTITNTGAGWRYDVLLNEDDLTQMAALQFAMAFNSEIGGICNENGNTNIVNLNNAWTELAESFATLSKEVKDLLKADLSTSTATDFVEFNSKYNYVYAKYHASLTEGNFISRDVSYLNDHLSVIKDNDLFATIIVIASCISILLLLSLVTIKKRKYQ